MSSRPVAAPFASTPRVLVIEDDNDTAHSLQALLQHAGFAVCCASDGAEGLAAAAHFDPHFVLLDMQLPVVHGVEVARHLRVNEDGMQRMIIVTSGLPSDSLDWSMCDLHLPKPIDIGRLLSILAEQWTERFEPARPRHALNGQNGS